MKGPRLRRLRAQYCIARARYSYPGVQGAEGGTFRRAPGRVQGATKENGWIKAQGGGAKSCTVDAPVSRKV